jgi:hypothetical protein
MRRALTALLLVGLAGTLIAQAPIVQAPDSPTKKVLLGNSPVTDITYGRAEKKDPKNLLSPTELSGGVQFRVGGMVMIADEASLDFRAGEIRLRGDVRLKIR